MKGYVSLIVLEHQPGISGEVAISQRNAVVDSVDSREHGVCVVGAMTDYGNAADLGMTLLMENERDGGDPA